MSKSKITNNDILNSILISEGWPAFSNDPSDRGGATKGGITLDTLAFYRNDQGVTVDELKALTEFEARSIYLKNYIEKPGFINIEDGLLRYQVVDCGVLSGPSRVIKWLQEVVAVKVDGVLGPKTKKAIQDMSPHIIGIRIATKRLKFLGALVSKDRSQAKWINGWIIRTTKFIDMEIESVNNK